MILTRLAPFLGFIRASCAAHSLDDDLLGAIIDREAERDPVTGMYVPDATGSDGHGQGLMQIDDRFHPEFCSRVLPSGVLACHDPESSIEYGAQLLEENWKTGSIYFHPGQFVTGAGYQSAVESIAVGIYNASWVKHVRTALDIAFGDSTTPFDPGVVLDTVDQCTTGKNYVSDVLARRTRIITARTNPPAPVPTALV